MSKAASTINVEQAAINDARATKARVEATPSTSSRIGRVYEGVSGVAGGVCAGSFLWLAGAALMGSCALVLYLAAVSALI